MRTVLGLCGDDWMIFKTNENFGGDTITYSLVHITTDGRIQHRESLADSTDPDDRKISLLGFGERFFRYQEAWAVRQLMIKLNDPDSTVKNKAVIELLACFDFTQGINADARQAFLEHPSNSDLFEHLTRNLRGLKGYKAAGSPVHDTSISKLTRLLSKANKKK